MVRNNKLTVDCKNIIFLIPAFDVYEQLQCEGHTWISQCPSYTGHVFLQGFLGRRDPKPCRPYSQGDVASCEVTGFLRRLQSSCFAQELCRFPVGRSDSCPASASAYMKATYACVPGGFCFFFFTNMMNSIIKPTKSGGSDH